MAYTTEGTFTTDSHGSVIGAASTAPSGLYLTVVKRETVGDFTRFEFVLSEPAPEDTWFWYHTANPSDVEGGGGIEGMGQSASVQIPVAAGNVVLDGAMLANRRTPVAIGGGAPPAAASRIIGQRGPVTTWFEEGWRYQAASGQVYRDFEAEKFGNGLIKVRSAFPIDGTGPLTADGYALVVERVKGKIGYRLIETEHSLRNFRFSDIKGTKLERGLFRLKSDPARGMFCGGTAEKPAIIENCDVDCGGEALYRERQAIGQSLVAGWFPVGMDFTHSGHIIVRDSTISGAWTPPQEETGEYQQGDGALTENKSHNIRFERVHVTGSGDAGFDLKGGPHTLIDCSAEGCKSSMKWWGQTGGVGVFTSRNPRLEHICVTGGWTDPDTGQAWRTRLEIEKLIIEGSNPDIPIIRFDGTYGAGVDVIIHDWEIIGMDPAQVVSTWKTGDGADTIDWGPKGPPSIINI